MVWKLEDVLVLLLFPIFEEFIHLFDPTLAYEGVPDTSRTGSKDLFMENWVRLQMALLEQRSHQTVECVQLNNMSRLMGRYFDSVLGHIYWFTSVRQLKLWLVL